MRAAFMTNHDHTSAADRSPDSAVIAHLGLGSNLGNRADTIDAALALLCATRGVSVLVRSKIIETPALVRPGAPAQPAYLNAAATVETTMSPRELLDAMLEVERQLGRVRSATERWEPRTIDMDLLLYADRVIDSPGLVVPHPAMHERLFVLQPLAEIAPDARHPVLGRTAAELFARLRAATPAGA